MENSVVQRCEGDISGLRLATLQESLARPMSFADYVALQQEQIAVLGDALDCLDDCTVVQRKLHHRLARALYDLGREQEALRVARRLFQRVDDLRVSDEIAKLIVLVERIENPGELCIVAGRLASAVPARAEFALLHARQLRRTGASREDELRVLYNALELDPENAAAQAMLVKCFTRSVGIVDDQSEHLAKLLAEHNPNSANFILYGRMLLLRNKQAEALAVFDRVGPRMDVAALGPFGKVLTELCASCNRNYYSEANVGLDNLRSVLDRSREGLCGFINSAPHIALPTIGRAVRELMAIHSTFDELGRFASASGALGGKVGSLELESSIVIFDALTEHVLIILQHALSESVLWRSKRWRNAVGRLVEVYTSLLLSQGRVSEVRVQLEKVAVLGFAQEVARTLHDVITLDEFQATGKFDRLSRAPELDATAGVHNTAFWVDWVESQGLVRRAMTVTGEQKGQYTVVNSNGDLQSAEYVQRPFRLELAGATSLRIRDGELLIGPKQIVLRPHSIHGPFPHSNLPSVLRATPDTLSLRPAGAMYRIDEPVVVLSNNNTARVHSYGHWLIFVLTRINAIVRNELLEFRKLLMPTKITPWMKETIHMVGVPSEKLLFFPDDQEVIVSDAEIVSAVDVSAGDLVSDLRRVLWSAVGVDERCQKEEEGLCLFLARKSQTRRMMLDDEEIYRMAEKLGYSVIAPEQLSVTDQVRLFSRAKAVAGPGGSAFANIMYARRGTRALCLKAEEKVSPFVLDMAVANGVNFRWLLGRSAPSLARYRHPWDAPFSVDMEQLERHLVWAKEWPRRVE